MEIKRAFFVTSMERYTNYEGIGLPEIAVAGKSNVGKSSMINSLCTRSSLAKVSGTPGKTRLINLFDINSAFYLTDLPGYGFAKVNKSEILRWGAMMEDYFRRAEDLVLTLHLVDIRHEPTEDDVTMNGFLRASDRPFITVATKADKISRGARMKYLAPICRKLAVQPWQVLCFSSENGSGREELLEKIGEALNDLSAEKQE